MPISTIKSGTCRCVKVSNATATFPINNYRKSKLDSHSDSIVTRSNCAILNHTGKDCDVSPCRNDYDTINNAPIIKAQQLPYTSQSCVLNFNEAIWMGYHIDNALLNPNQLHHCSIRVQDDPTSPCLLSLIAEDNEFCIELSIESAIVHADTYSPSENDLRIYPHMELSSPHSQDKKM